jgi:hypothetical protein
MKSENAHAGARPSRRVGDLPVIVFEVPEEASDFQVAPAAKNLAFTSAPVDQRDVPCCVSIALTAAMQFVGSTPLLAPLFNYFLSRLNSAVIDDIEIADAFRSAMNRGVCSEGFHKLPFDTASALLAPSVDAMADALSRRLVPAAGKPSFGRVKVEEAQWKAAIESSVPVLMGFFMSPEYEKILQGTMSILNSPTSRLNGHACLVIGYDDGPQEFTIRDSRGPGVGVTGTWQLPYSRLAEGFIFESWAVTAVP